jgi:DNA-binding MarR family transcriptional regulator
VTREPHPTDRRATLVTFTDRGVRTALKLAAGQRELADLLFAGMPDRRFDGLVGGQAEVLDRLRAALAPAQSRR